jgi:alpha-D-ribose 1-methylphosphonate 5-triphosphate diphosphatase
MRILGGKVLVAESFIETDLTLEGGIIASVGGAGGGKVFDASGLLVLPGIVDIHGDAFERQIMPRPGVAFDLDIALLDTDRQLAANGITTAYHGVTWSWEPGLRGTQSALAIIEAIHRLQARFSLDTRVHLRHETFNLEAEPAICGLLAQGRIGCLAFNDHTTGTILVRHRPEKMRKMIERSGLTPEAFMELVERVAKHEAEVAPSLRRLAAAAQARGVPLLSHDDMTPQMRADFRTMGCGIAEFPIDEATAEASALGNDAIVFGAPNAVRGSSHTGCPSARDMVARGLCTALASDYFYPALLHAPFILEREGICSLEQGWKLVSQGPAAALGLTDRGRIEAGLRADLVLVDPQKDSAVSIAATIMRGAFGALMDTARLGP